MVNKSTTELVPTKVEPVNPDADKPVKIIKPGPKITPKDKPVKIAYNANNFLFKCIFKWSKNFLSITKKKIENPTINVRVLVDAIEKK